MHGELVDVMTSDRVRLDGFYMAAKGVKDGYLDAAVITHGLSGNFYSSRLLKYLAVHLVDRGISTVIINTRGHDYLNLTVRSGRSQTLGAAYERVDECPQDINAWVEFLTNQGHQNVVLLGHSLGAIKTLYAQAHAPCPEVKAVCGLSATRLSYDALLASPGGDRFSHWLKMAAELVADRRADELMYVDFPFPTWISASAYLEKYGAGDQLNWLNFIQQIRVPTWLGFGELELAENPAFLGLQGELDQVDEGLDNITIETISGADHFYSARFEAVGRAIDDWMNRCHFC